MNILEKTNSIKKELLVLQQEINSLSEKEILQAPEDRLIKFLTENLFFQNDFKPISKNYLFKNDHRNFFNECYVVKFYKQLKDENVISVDLTFCTMELIYCKKYTKEVLDLSSVRLIF